MRVLVTGGGTGGHIYPALAIIKGLKKKKPATQFLYIGTKKGMEADIVPKEGLEFRTITIAGLERKFSWSTMVTLSKVPKGLWDAWRIIKDYKPDVVIGTGGYVCGPVVLIASLMKIPTVIHEQNAYPGITNKILARFVDEVCVTFSDSIKYFPPKTKVSLTGLPVRPEIIKATRETGYQKLNLDPGKFTLLVFGGSRGAQSINEAMISTLKKISVRDMIQVLHVTGSLTFDQTVQALENEGIQLDEKGNIKVVPYLYNMQDALAVADLVICRAGAATLAEITAKGIPAILIPYPFAAENHQEFNALALEKRGAAVMIKNSELNGTSLAEIVLNLYTQKEKLATMATNSRQLGILDAIDKIIDCIEQII